MKKKYISFLLILILISTTLTGCTNGSSIENAAYVVAIGIDKGTTNKIKLSLQFALPMGISGGGSTSGSGGSSQSSTSEVISVECSNIDSGINLINSYLSKKVNLSHCKAITISQNLAYDGVSEYIYTLANNVQIRPDCYVIVSRCDAYDFLDKSKSTLETLSAKYYDLILNSSKYTGYSDAVRLSEFYSNITDSSCQAYAISGGINSKDTQFTDTNIPTYDLDSIYKAGESPLSNESGLENIGLAVFNGDRLVGELNSLETLCHLIIVNKLETAIVSIPSPFNKDETIALSIELESKTTNSVEFINTFPYIKSYVRINANVSSLNSHYNYSDKENIRLLEEYASNYLENNISNYLYKTAKEFKSDIAGFGIYARKYYWTLEDWNNSDWLNNYENSFFDVKVDVNVKGSYLFNKL